MTKEKVEEGIASIVDQITDELNDKVKLYYPEAINRTYTAIPKDELATLRAESLIKDTRIKELEKDRDEFACRFVECVEQEYYQIVNANGTWYQVYDRDGGKPGITTLELLEEYKNRLTK